MPDTFDILKDDMLLMTPEAFVVKYGVTLVAAHAWRFNDGPFPWKSKYATQETPADVGDDDLRHGQRQPLEAA